jgi:PAS domain S-box-containing protein
VSVGPTVAQILGRTAEDLVGKKTLDLIHPDERAPAIANRMEMLSRPGLSQRAIMRCRHRDGQYIWFEITHSNLLNDPALRVVRSEMVDVSERMEAIEQLRAGERLRRRSTEALALGMGVAWTDTAVGCDAIVAIADQAMCESKRTAAGPVLPR